VNEGMRSRSKVHIGLTWDGTDGLMGTRNLNRELSTLIGYVSIYFSKRKNVLGVLFSFVEISIEIRKTPSLIIYRGQN